LLLKDLSYSQHESSQRVVWGLVGMFYTSEQEQTEAYQHLAQHFAPTQSSSNTSSVPITESFSSNDQSRRIAHSMATRFKSTDKFNGKLGEDIGEFINNYMDAARDYGFKSSQKLDFFHHMFDGEAKDSIRVMPTSGECILQRRMLLLLTTSLGSARSLEISPETLGG